MGFSLILVACAGTPVVQKDFGTPPASSAVSVDTAPVSAVTPVVITAMTLTAVAPEPYQCPFGKSGCIIVSKFGARTVPGKDVKEPHYGVCLRTTPGQKVRASRAGKVIFAGFSKEYVSRANKKEQHRLVIVHHAEGQSTRYVHLNELSVRPMQEVKAGDVLGTASESDEWTEPVLHFEIREANGKPMNPEPLLKASAKL